MYRAMGWCFSSRREGELSSPNKFGSYKAEPGELTGKYIILDVLARDGEGHCYNVEAQVRRYDAWHKRGLFYLARMLGTQLSVGEDYQELRASVGLHLLDFDLFTDTAAEREQAIWRFEMRDERQPHISLGNVLQMNLIELNKADRLGLPEGSLRAWITFFNLNLIRAGIAATPEGSAHTSVAERITELKPESKHVPLAEPDEPEITAVTTIPAWCDSLPPQPLMPFDATAQLSNAIPFSFEDYLELVETTGRCQRPDKRGAIPERTPRLLQRLNIEPEAFIAASTTLLQRFGSAVGTPTSLTACSAARQIRHLRGMRAARELFERQVA